MLEAPRQPLQLREVPVPAPAAGQLLVRVSTCAVCRTDLHIVDGELPDPKLPLILGHQIVGRVERIGEGVNRFRVGERVGIPWLGWTCGECEYCRSDRENLCNLARFTGYTIDGGYAEFTVADARFCFPIPDAFDVYGAGPGRRLRGKNDGAIGVGVPPAGGFFGHGSRAAPLRGLDRVSLAAKDR